MSDFKYDDDILGDFICTFKKHYFTQFMSYRGQNTASVTEKECAFHQGEKCIYHLAFTP
jgi:hypothetical protein